MKTRIHKLLGIVVTLALLGSLTLGLSVPVAASDGSWSSVATPMPGALGGYMLGPATGYGPGVGPGPFEMAKDGTLYAAWDIGEGAFGANLYKSTNFGVSWTRCSNVTDDLGDVVITDIALSPQDANRVYVTDGTSVYRSIDAGATFVKLVDPPAGGIVALEAVYNGDNFVYAAVDGGGSSDEIYMMRDAFGYAWTSTNFAAAVLASTTGDTPRDVLDIVASPNFSSEALPMVLAINAGALGTYATFSYGGAAWAAPIPGGDDQKIASIVATAADVAFPADFNSTRGTRDFFIGLSDACAGGDVYRMISTTVVPLLVGGGIDITSVAVAGNTNAGKLLAAGNSSFETYHSEDNGLTWTQSDPYNIVAGAPLSKDLAQGLAGSCKLIIMANDYLTSGKALIAVEALGTLDESSVALTTDFGASWTDLSMINTAIDSVLTMDVSDKYATDGTLFLVTDCTTPSATGSIWKKAFGEWMRVSTTDNASSTALDVSADYSIDRSVYLVDYTAQKIYRSSDYGMCFRPQFSSPGAIDGGFLIINASTMLVGVADKAMVTRNGGTSWDAIACAAPGAKLFSFAKSPAYDSDKTIAAGDDSGHVFISKDAGASWLPLGTAGSGCVNVIFDAGYAMNGSILAASSGTNSVYRLLGTSWLPFDGGAGAKAGSINSNLFVPGMQMAADGTLYVSSPVGMGGFSGTTAAADAFTILDPPGTVVGTISVVAGTVTVDHYNNLSVLQSSTPVTGPASTAFAATGAGDYFVVTNTASSGSATGTWLMSAGSASAAISVDIDGDASVAATGGAFSLPDTSSTSMPTSGSTQLALRSLTKTRTFCEQLTSGFMGSASSVMGVWYNDANGAPQIWVLEGAAKKIWTYTDKLTKAGTLASPADKTTTGRVTEATLVWNALPTATFYEVQVGLDAFFSAQIGTPAYVMGTSYSLTGLQDGTTYYWRVRSAPNTVTPPGRASSPWSATWSFTTGIAGAEWTPFDNAGNVAPAPGAQGVALRPGFQWNPADWATGYEFQLDDSSDFSSPIKSFVGSSALATTAYALDTDLSYSTTYVWRVRAVSATSESLYGVGTFTTMAQPTTAPPAVIVTETQPPAVTLTIPPAEPAAEITPAWIWAIVIIGGVLVIAVIVLIVTTRRVP